MSEKILSCFFQTMYFGVLIGLSCLHGKKKAKDKEDIVYSRPVSLVYSYASKLKEKDHTV